jgi:lipase
VDLHRYRPTSVPVPDVAGAALGGGDWEGDGFPVLGIPGLTSNHRLLHLLAEALPDHRLVAQDARGRASGFGVPCPDSLTTHAGDLARLLDDRGIDKAVVAGHSMGGFIALRFAQLHPDRVHGLVLLDGGPPVKLPGILASRWAVRTTFQLRLRKAFRTYADIEDLQRWLAEKADGFGHLDPDFLRWGFEIDLAGPTGKMTLQQDLPVLLADAAECFCAPWRAEALRTLAMPCHIVLAQWGAKQGAKPLYRSDPEPATLAPGTTVQRVTGSDHVSILTDPASLEAITALVPA